jgi:surface antigen
MGAHRTTYDLHSSALVHKDPGAGGTITPDKGLAIVNLVSAAAEARTLGRPTREGTIYTLAVHTYVGDNEAGSTSYVFTAAGQFATFVAINVGSTLTWRKIADSASGAGTSPAQSAALTPATGGTIDGTYGAEEAAEIANMVVRIGEIEAALEAAGIVAPN